MKILKGPKTLILSIVFGALIISYLVSFGDYERYSLVIITIFICNFIGKRKKINIPYLTTIFIGVVMGMMLCTYGLLFWELEENTTIRPAAIDENFNTAVLLIFDGEAERYNLPILLNNMDSNEKITNKLVTPFRLYVIKGAYENLGISRYMEISERIRLKLSNQLDNGYDVFASYINNGPFYGDMIEEDIFKQNYKKVIVVPICLTESADYHSIVRQLEMKNLSYRNTRLKFSYPLWDSEKISRAVAGEIYRNNKNISKSEVGIILMDMDFNKNLNPKIVNQEQSFMEEIKKQLIENGYEDRKISVTSLYPNTSEINNTIGGLEQYGVSKIFIIGINDILDKIEVQDKVENLIRKIKRDDGKDFIYIKGWGDGQFVIDELEYRVRLMNVEEWDR